MDFIELFRQSMVVDGIKTEAEINPNGTIHRFHITGDDPASKNGWYVLYPDPPYGGAYGCWKRQIDKKWSLKSSDQMTEVERTVYAKRIFQAKQARAKLRKQAVYNARIIWEQSLPANNTHPYLKRKNVSSYGLRTDKNNRLIVPLYDKSQEICSLQFISPSGEKRFLKGSNISGGHYIFGNQKNIADSIYIAEGYATCATIHEAINCTVVCCFNCNNILAVAKTIRERFPHTVIIIAADNDAYTKGNPGLTKAREAATAINARVVYPKFTNTEDSISPSDFNDLIKISGIDATRSTLESANALNLKEQSLPTLKTEVIQLQAAMLPEAICDYIFDVAARQQSAPDFIAVTAVVALSGLLGRKAVIHPKQHDDWEVTPNQWGAIIGRPSAMKSPSMKEALKPLRKIDTRLVKQFEEEKILYEAEEDFAEITQRVSKENAKRLIKNGKHSEAMTLIEDSKLSISTPTRKRLTVNDSTIEKLGELLNENPNGLTLVRDELAGWLSQLSKEDGQQDRAFYLECFDGNSHFVYDRIGRGTIEIRNCTLSIIGGIQPAKILPLIRDTVRGQDDGLIQRFQLLTWPDDIGTWVWIDRLPDQLAKEKYFNIFEEIYALNLNQNESTPKIFHFSNDAQELFSTWMEEINKIARSNDIHPILESYILKMPQTIAGLALLFELMNGGRDNVGIDATCMAILWADYLLSHARRLYSNVINQGLKGAHLLLERKNKLTNPFTAREVQRKTWPNLETAEMVSDALNWLLDYGYLAAKETVSTSNQGGRSTTTYEWRQKNEKQPNTGGDKTDTT